MVRADTNIKIIEELEESRKNEALLTSLLENSSQPFGVGYPDGRLGFINRAFEELTGYSRDELKSINWSEILTPNEFQDMETEKLQELERTGIPIKYEKEYIRKDGTRVPIELLVDLIKNEDGTPKYYYSFITDITERKKAEEALKESEENYRHLLNYAPTAIYEIDYKGPSFKSVNEALINLSGYSREELLSMNPLDILDFESKKRFMDRIKRGLSGEKIDDEVEYKVIHKDGRKLWVILNNKPIYKEGKIVGALVVGHDITKRRQDELLKEELLENEQQLTEELQTSNEELQSTTEELRQQGNDLKRINQLLRDSEEKYRSILDNLQDAYIRADKEGNIIMASPSAARMYRFNSPKEMIGSSALSFYKNPEDRNYVIEELKKHGKIENNEVEALRKDGTAFIASQNAQFHYDYQGQIQGTETLVRDITETKQAEEEILMQRKLLDAINKVFQESLTTETDKEVIGKCLEVAEELTGSEFGFFGEINENGRLDDRALSPPAWDVCETPNAHKLLKNMEIVSYWGRTIKEEKSQIVNNPDIDPDSRGLPEGHPPITSFLGVPLKENEKTIGMIALANKKAGYNETDKSNVEAITVAFVEVLMRKRAEIEIKENLKRLAQSNKELEQFAYITSHDLREPLRMITSFLQLLERRYKDQLDQDANEFIGFAVDGAKRLDSMTNDLLLYSRITSEKREVKPVNFEHVLEEALINLKVPIEENNAVITHDPLPTINGDEKLKVQLFQNIIGNAIKYRSQETPQIHISATKEKNQYLFSIKDNGMGMSPEHLKKIFTIFQRLHTHEEYEGTGIGLAIAQKIVHQQGGQIWAESELGKGTIFYFTIPINPDNLFPSTNDH